MRDIMRTEMMDCRTEWINFGVGDKDEPRHDE
jgi:hypothetical protein